MNLHNLDSIIGLRLLLEVCRTGQLTMAAEKFGLSVSAASRQLHQLREVFGDELLKRTGAGMTPTPLLKSIAPQIEAVVAGIDEIGRRECFSPGDAVGTFRISAYDNGFTSFIEPILPTLKHRAPKLEIEVQMIHDVDTEVVDGLRRGTADLVIHPNPSERADIIIRDIVEQDYVLLASAESPLAEAQALKGRIDLADLKGLTQVFPSSRAMHPWIWLKEMGQYTVQVPYFNASAFLALGGDAFVWMSRGTAARWTALGRFTAVEPPEGFECSITPRLAWSRHRDADPLHQWVRSLILSAVRAAG